MTRIVENIAAKTVKRIYKVARESLRLHPKDDEAAAEAMLATLGMNAELDFLAGEALRKTAGYYLAEARGGGRVDTDARFPYAPAIPMTEVTGSFDVTDPQRSESLAGADDKDQTSDDTQWGSVQSVPATPLSGFAQPLAGADDKGQREDDTQPEAAPSAPAPRPRQPIHHAAASEVLTKSLLDEFKVTLRQGSRVSYGGVRLASLPRMYRQYGKGIWVKEREREVVRQTIELGKKQSYLPEDAEVRDLLDDKTLDMFIKKAMLVADGKASITYSPEQPDD